MRPLHRSIAPTRAAGLPFTGRAARAAAVAAMPRPLLALSSLLTLSSLLALPACRPAGKAPPKPLPTFAAKAATTAAAVKPHAAPQPAPLVAIVKERGVPQTAYSRLVGSRAADIDIEHWIEEGHEPVQPFRSFEPGKIYVIEFWATWCPYCGDVFQLLASLQRKYADQGLTVIAVGNEPPEAVKAFLADTSPETRAAAEAARHCVLTTDPDDSVFRDYMDAVADIGIPTAFIIGRQGIVEWIGHAQDIEEPLRMVVEDRWDRTAFAEKTRKIESVRASVKGVEELLQNGRQTEAVAAYERLVAANADEADKLNEVAWMAWELAEARPLPGEMVAAAVAAATRSLEREPHNGNFLDTLAHHQALQGDLDAALATQQRAVEHPGPFAARILGYLRELEAQKKTARH